MSEIIISSPDINQDPLSGWTYNNEGIQPVISLLLERDHVSPQSHPRAVDLCAGDGACADLLIRRGWDSKNIVCVDMFKSFAPYPKNVTWKYWDLSRLGRYLREDKPIPGEVLDFRSKFDIVLLWFGCLGSVTEATLCSFFLRPGGHISHDRLSFCWDSLLQRANIPVDNNLPEELSFRASSPDSMLPFKLSTTSLRTFSKVIAEVETA